MLAGCGEEGGDSTPSKEAAVATSDAASESKVLAVVDGTRITERDLQQAQERMFKNASPLPDPAQYRPNLLRSLIASRAISRLAERELSQEAVASLEARVAAYREELLMKEYLSAHANPQPISGDMVEKYYNDHPQEFGGGTTKRFEIVQTQDDLRDEERAEAIRLLGSLASVDDWRQWVQQHQEIPLVWRKLKARVELLEQPMKSLVSATDPGSASSLHMGRRLTIVKVNAVEPHPPRPLLEVSAEIRKKLAPIKMRDAVKAIADAAVQQAHVEIVE